MDEGQSSALNPLLTQSPGFAPAACKAMQVEKGPLFRTMR
jgi:hypothetical protein